MPKTFFIIFPILAFIIMNIIIFMMLKKNCGDILPMFNKNTKKEVANKIEQNETNIK